MVEILDTSIPLPFVYLIEQIIGDDNNITFFNVKQEKELFNNGFSPNGSSEIKIDNLKNDRVKQYIKKTKNGDESITTDISQHRLKNHKYSKYLAHIIVLLSSIEHISYENISEILNLFFKINISRQRVYDLYAENVKEFIYKKHG